MESRKITDCRKTKESVKRNGYVEVSCLLPHSLSPLIDQVPRRSIGRFTLLPQPIRPFADGRGDLRWHCGHVGSQPIPVPRIQPVPPASLAASLCLFLPQSPHLQTVWIGKIE